MRDTVLSLLLREPQHLCACHGQHLPRVAGGGKASGMVNGVPTVATACAAAAQHGERCFPWPASFIFLGHAPIVLRLIQTRRNQVLAVRAEVARETAVDIHAAVPAPEAQVDERYGPALSLICHKPSCSNAGCVCLSCVMRSSKLTSCLRQACAWSSCCSCAG